MTAPSVQYVTLDDSLKQLRAELRREFPGVTFSIRRSRGTGYGYVYLSWTDGPTGAAVRAISAMYEGAGFDGMTDSSFPIEHTAADAHGNPIRIKHSTKGIDTNRHLSPGRMAAAVRDVCRTWGDWADPAKAAALAANPNDAEVEDAARSLRTVLGYEDAQVRAWHVLSDTTFPAR